MSTPKMHLKTGNIYLAVTKVINATNAQNGQRMVLYKRHDGRDTQFYVREVSEFDEKFEDIPEEDAIVPPVRFPRVQKLLIAIAAFGPMAYFIADKVAHLFGLCLGG